MVPKITIYFNEILSRSYFFKFVYFFSKISFNDVEYYFYKLNINDMGIRLTNVSMTLEVTLYQKYREWCINNNFSVSEITESLITKFLENNYTVKEMILPSDKLYYYLLEAKGEWKTKTELRNLNFVGQNNFAKWLKHVVGYVENKAKSDNLIFEVEQNGSRGSKFRILTK